MLQSPHQDVPFRVLEVSNRLAAVPNNNQIKRAPLSAKHYEVVGHASSGSEVAERPRHASAKLRSRAIRRTSSNQNLLVARDVILVHATK